MKKLALVTLSATLLAVSCQKEDQLNQTAQKSTEQVNSNKKEEQHNATVAIDTIEIAPNLTRPTIKRGYYGFVIEKKGDFMPRTNEDTSSMGTIDSVQRDVYIYNNLTLDSLKNAETSSFSGLWYINKIEQQPVAILKPNKQGFYEINLEQGEYSGLIKINDSLLFNREIHHGGRIGLMNISAETIHKKDFIIDNEESY